MVPKIQLNSSYTPAGLLLLGSATDEPHFCLLSPWIDLPFLTSPEQLVLTRARFKRLMSYTLYGVIHFLVFYILSGSRTSGCFITLLLLILMNQILTYSNLFISSFMLCALSILCKKRSFPNYSLQHFLLKILYVIFHIENVNNMCLLCVYSARQRRDYFPHLDCPLIF